MYGMNGHQEPHLLYSLLSRALTHMHPSLPNNTHTLPTVTHLTRFVALQYKIPTHCLPRYCKSQCCLYMPSLLTFRLIFSNSTSKHLVWLQSELLVVQKIRCRQTPSAFSACAVTLTLNTKIIQSFHKILCLFI